jgi:ABC-type nitrate/sulfonate/bicarbonate transport system substrate-binding protein
VKDEPGLSVPLSGENEYLCQQALETIKLEAVNSSAEGHSVQNLALKRTLLAGASVLGVMAALVGAWSCSRAEDTVSREPIRIGTLPLETSSLVMIADEKGYFSKNGIDVEFKYYDTGLGILDGLLGGEVDMATPVGEFAMVGKIFSKEDIKTIGAIDRVDYQRLVGRRDHGINGVSDLAGKKVGVIRNTQEEFYLARFLQLNNVSATDVTLVHVPLAQSVDSITRGDVDAMVMVPPYLGEAQRNLGSNAVIWPVQSGQLTQQLMVCNSQWISGQGRQVAEYFCSFSRPVSGRGYGR